MKSRTNFARDKPVTNEMTDNLHNVAAPSTGPRDVAEEKGAMNGSLAPNSEVLVHHDACWMCRHNIFLGGHVHQDGSRG